MTLLPVLAHGELKDLGAPFSLTSYMCCLNCKCLTQLMLIIQNNIGWYTGNSIILANKDVHTSMASGWLQWWPWGKPVTEPQRRDMYFACHETSNWPAMLPTQALRKQLQLCHSAAGSQPGHATLQPCRWPSQNYSPEGQSQAQRYAVYVDYHCTFREIPTTQRTFINTVCCINYSLGINVSALLINASEHARVPPMVKDSKLNSNLQQITHSLRISFVWLLICYLCHNFIKNIIWNHSKYH